MVNEDPREAIPNPSSPQFHNSDEAKKALEQLNGFELAGRPMKVNHVTERSESQPGSSLLDSDEMERAGIDLGEAMLGSLMLFKTVF